MRDRVAAPPAIAQALVVAVTPPADCDSVLGDLHEEYVQLLAGHGSSAANRWYWSQVLRSMPSLLGYSRARNTFASIALSTLVMLVVIVLMMTAFEMLEDVIGILYRGHGIPNWALYLAGWLDAAFFGAVLAMVLRTRATRGALLAAMLMLAFIAFPIVLGFSSRLSAHEWFLILGAVPAMVLGAGIAQIIRRKLYTTPS